MSRIKYSLLISLGLALRIIVLIFSSQSLQSNFYAPFLKSFEFQRDPWRTWVESGGDISAFPYGIFMLIAHIPSILISKISFLSEIGFLNTQLLMNILLILIADILIAKSIRIQSNTIKSLVYWLNPAVIYVNYSLGSNDILPSFFILMSGILILKHRAALSGAMLGVAAGMKFSLVLLVPFLVIYLIDNPRYRGIIQKYILNFFLIFSLSYIPAIYSEDFRTMVLSNPEISKFMTFGISMGTSKLVIFPFIYIGFMYWLWRAGRTSLQTLVIFLSAVLITLSFVNLSATGWILWGLPLLILYTDLNSRSQLILQTLFPLAMLSVVVSNNEINNQYFGYRVTESASSLSFTLAFAVLIIFLISTLRHSVDYGDIYKLGKQPIAIAISGDSGTGKSKLSGVISEFFGNEFVCEICGDDYHKFERSSEIWSRATHLNPAANNMGLWVSNLKLARQRKTFSQKKYDHVSGIFSTAKSAKPADLVISQGLHASYMDFKEIVDLFVHLEIEEPLRERLKIQRDITERGKTAREVSDSLIARKPDSERFISLQMNEADLVFTLRTDNASLNTFTLELSAKDYSLVPAITEVLSRNGISDFQSHVNQKQKQILTIGYDRIKSNEAVEILKRELESFDQLFVGKPSIAKSESATMLLFIFLALDWKLLNK